MKKRAEKVTDRLMDLKSCKNLTWGRIIHAKAVDCRDDSNVYIVNALVNMYRKTGSMLEARLLFENIQEPNVVSWNTLLSGYAEKGEAHIALDLFSTMKQCGCTPNPFTYNAVLKACMAAVNSDGSGKADCLERGRKIHAEIGLQLDQYVQGTLVDMYSKCGCMVEARRVFDSISKPDVVSWNALLFGYAGNGEAPLALDLFSKMKSAGCSPDSFTYMAAVKACTYLAVSGKSSCLELARDLHSQIGYHLNHYLQNTLIDMYAKCGSMVDARQVFDGILEPDKVSWNALLLGYAANGDGHSALDVLSEMKAAGFTPDSLTYIAALKACMVLGKNGGLDRGRQIHSEIRCYLNHDRNIQSTLIDMYGKCSSMVDARAVFDGIVKPDLVSWTALLLGYAENGEGHIALDLFLRLKAEGFSPDCVSYIAAIKACTSLAVNGDGRRRHWLQVGKEIHSEIGGQLDICLKNMLIDMYSSCGSMANAHAVFDSINPKPDVVSWTSLLLGYADNGEPDVTLNLFCRMKESGCVPNSVTYISTLKASGFIGALAVGRKLHFEITEFTPRLVSCLVDFYSKCGSMREAREVFDLHSNARTITAWSALLAGYARFGDSDSVFKIFEAMEDEGLVPDEITFVCLLLCCSHAGLVEKAREYLEAMPVQYHINPTVIHYTCMVDVLGRGNQLDKAMHVIQKMPCNPDTVTWTTLLAACRKWKNLEIGREVFRALVDMCLDAFPYVLMADIYGSKGMWEEQKRVTEMRRDLASKVV